MYNANADSQCTRSWWDMQNAIYKRRHFELFSIFFRRSPSGTNCTCKW